MKIFAQTENVCQGVKAGVWENWRISIYWSQWLLGKGERLEGEKNEEGSMSDA